MNLYKLTPEQQAILDAVDEDGVIHEEASGIRREDPRELVLLIQKKNKETKAEIEVLTAHAKEVLDKVKRKKAAIVHRNAFCQLIMQNNGLKKVRDPFMTVSLRSNLKPVYNDEISAEHLMELGNEFPEWVRTTQELNKQAIGDAIKAHGYEVPPELRSIVKVELAESISVR